MTRRMPAPLRTLLRQATAFRRRLRRSEATFIILAVVVGSVTGGLSVALGAAAHALQALLFGLPGEMRLSAMPHLPWSRLLALPAGGAVLGLLQYALERWRRRTPVDVVEANALHGGAVPWRDSLSVTAQTFASNGFGASVGLEAAYAQVGGGLASVIGRRLSIRRSDLRILVGAGAGAAIGAAFGAPLTGAFYAFEIVIGAYTPAAIAPVAAAAIAGVATARSLGGVPYLITVSSVGVTRNMDYLAFVGIGLACAFVGIALMRSVSLVEAGVRRIGLPAAARPFLGGLLLMPIAFLSPEALSAGHGALHLTLAGDAPILILCGVLALKWLASSVSLGFGFRGGLFFASLFLGVLVGRIYAGATEILLPGAPHLWTQDAALVGMAALAVAVIGGPMTMTFLVLEATRDFQLAAIVLTASLVASAVVRELFGYSFSTWRLHLRGEVIRSARDIGWVRQLTARSMMRAAPVTAPAAITIAALRRRVPLGSTGRIILLDAEDRYAGIVATTDAFADGVDCDAAAATLARRPDETIDPARNITEVMQVFDRLGVDDLAVVAADGALLGTLTEAHVRKRYANELERSQRELFGEA
ncbi:MULTISPECIES: chloride channel protein [unclassified Sphingomonas]|uniref:chloride channel protein n=1 Tax=unclassified Sphingomonas TaxID=196159 RepID=UPI00226A4857|nr:MULTISPECIES: chloride channel protein [unclassified Sphingomonas]